MYNEYYNEYNPVISGTIFETGEKCKMQINGYWIGGNGRHISSYERIDNLEPEHDKYGRTVYRQYSMDRHHKFYLETEDVIY